MDAMYKNLALNLVRVTESAALAAGRFLGRGQKEAGDGAAVDAPVKDNLTHIAKAIDKKISELVVFVLEKPRHRQLISDIRKSGACIQLHADGDVAGSLMVVNPESDVDVMMGTGGTPEGIISAAAIHALGGQMFARLAPRSASELQAIQSYGTDLNEILTVETLTRSKDAFFAATGISGGSFLSGTKYGAKGASSHSMIINGMTGTVRFIRSFHRREIN